MKPVPYEQLPDEELVFLARENRRAMEILLIRYTPLLERQATALQCMCDAEDLMQEGYLGLISAVCRYDGSRGVPFSAYASRCVKNQMLSALRRYRHLPLPVGSSDVPPFSQVQDPSLQPDSVVQSRTQVASMVHAMVNRLSRREYQVCMMIYGGATYAQTAHKLHISEKSVDNALQRARRKLRTEEEIS